MTVRFPPRRNQATPPAPATSVSPASGGANEVNAVGAVKNAPTNAPRENGGNEGGHEGARRTGTVVSAVLSTGVGPVAGPGSLFTLRVAGGAGNGTVALAPGASHSAQVRFAGRTLPVVITASAAASALLAQHGLSLDLATGDFVAAGTRFAATGSASRRYRAANGEAAPPFVVAHGERFGVPRALAFDVDEAGRLVITAPRGLHATDDGARAQRGAATGAATGAAVPVAAYKLVTPHLIEDDGGPSVSGIFAFLREVPAVKKDLAVAVRLVDEGVLRIGSDVELFGDRAPRVNNPLYLLTEPNGHSSVVINTQSTSTSRLAKAGALAIMVLHELVHVGDTERLKESIVRHRDRFPANMLSDKASDIASGRRTRVGGDLFMDRNLFLWMTEQRAYFAMNRVYDALVRNEMDGVRFVGDAHLDIGEERDVMHEGFGSLEIAAALPETLATNFPRANRRVLEEILLQRGVSREELDGLSLPEHLSPITFYVLGQYLRSSPDPDGPAIDVAAATTRSFLHLSVKQILDGALLSAGDP